MGSVSFSIDLELVSFLCNTFGCEVFFETGTYKGDTVEKVKDLFGEIYSVECSEKYFDECRTRFKGIENVHLFFGRSEEILKDLSESFANRSMFYWLDAHWCQEDEAFGSEEQCPLLAELNAIDHISRTSIVLIDDARFFLGTPPGNHFLEDWPTFDSLYGHLQRLSMEHELLVFNDIFIFYPKGKRSEVRKYTQIKSVDVLKIFDKARDFDSLLSQLKSKDNENRNLFALSKTYQESLNEKEQEIVRLAKVQEELHAGILEKEKLIQKETIFRSRILRQARESGVSLAIDWDLLTNDIVVSIVIPTFNQGVFIRDCLDSILNQSYRTIEVIVQDSESDDETESICQEFTRRDPRVRYYREKDGGQSEAINRGLHRSSGELWTWMCSDDKFASSDCVSEMIAHYRRQLIDPKMVGVFGKANYISDDGGVLHDYYQVKRDIFRGDFQENWPLSQPSALLLRKRVIEVGGVKECLHLGMDLDLFVRVLEGERYFSFLDTQVAEVRLQHNSKSVKLREDTAMCALDIVKRHFGSFGNLQSSAYFRELVSCVGEADAHAFVTQIGTKREWASYWRQSFVQKWFGWWGKRKRVI